MMPTKTIFMIVTPTIPKKSSSIMHMLDIAGTDAVLGRAHGFKQHRLTDGMEDHEQDGSPYGLFHADAGAGDDQS